jgi:hypothetical protein
LGRYLTAVLQAEQEAHQLMIEEKQSRALLKNTLDPLLSRLTKASGGGGGRERKRGRSNTLDTLPFRLTKLTVHMGG